MALSVFSESTTTSPFRLGVVKQAQGGLLFSVAGGRSLHKLRVKRQKRCQPRRSLPLLARAGFVSLEFSPGGGFSAESR